MYLFFFCLSELNDVAISLCGELKNSRDAPGKNWLVFVTFSGKWSTKDVNVKNQEYLYSIFDVNVFRSTPRERQIFWGEGGGGRDNVTM